MKHLQDFSFLLHHGINLKEMQLLEPNLGQLLRKQIHQDTSSGAGHGVGSSQTGG